MYDGVLPLVVRVPEIELRHLQDFAASLGFFTGERLLTQEFPHQTQGFHFLLQALEFGFFATKYFDGVFHGLSLVNTLRAAGTDAKRDGGTRHCTPCASLQLVQNALSRARLSANMHHSREFRSLVLLSIILVTCCLWLVIRRMKPCHAERLLIPANFLVVLYWLAVVPLVLFSTGTFVTDLALVIYPGVFIVRSWLNTRAQFLQMPPVRLRFPIFRIRQRTYIEVANPDSAATWYSMRLGLQRLVPKDSNARVELKWSATDAALVLTTRSPLSTRQFPILSSRNLDLARKELAANGVNVGPIETDRQGTNFFEFHDPDGNVIEICSAR